MSIPRIVELNAGLATGMLGIIVAVTIFKDDFDTSRRLEREFRPLQEHLILLIFFTAPNLLVAIGAYFHAVRRDSGPGRLMIFFGSAFVLGLFLLFEINAGYAAMYRIGLRFWPVVLTLITAGSSFAVRGNSRRHNDA
jgi:hypothetical protein